MGYTLRTNQYRYTKWVGRYDFNHYAAELYDYQIDPLETINRVADPDYRTIVAKLDSIVQLRIQIPSSQNKLQFSIYGLNEKNDSVNIGNARINFLEKIHIKK